MTSPPSLTRSAEPVSGNSPAPRVMIACTGLGHIRRGNEAWAQNVAEGLHRAGSPVTLAGGGPLRGAECPYQRIMNLPREFALTRKWVPWHRRYWLEQLSATAALLVRREWRHFDIMHVPDPDVALQLRRRTKGTRLKVIYKDGLSLGASFCSLFEYVQVLAPYYLQTAREKGFDTSRWFLIPHLVNTHRFTPPENRAESRMAARIDGVKPDDRLVLAVGDFSPLSNKRLDWVVSEVAKLHPAANFHLVLAGQASAAEFAQFERQARGMLGDRVHLFQNLDSSRMISLYRAADIFVHAALREPFGIVFLEAMASGLPVVAHEFAVTQWIIGDGGRAVDMTEAGRLAEVLESWGEDRDLRHSIGARARLRATEVFSEEQIIPLYQQMYQRIAAGTALL